MKCFNTEYDKMLESNKIFGEVWEEFHEKAKTGAKRRHDETLAEVCAKHDLESDQLIQEFDDLKAENANLHKQLARVHDFYRDAAERNIQEGEDIQNFIRKVSQKTTRISSPNREMVLRETRLVAINLELADTIQLLTQTNTNLVDVNRKQADEITALKSTKTNEAENEHTVGSICDSMATLLNLNHGAEYLLQKRRCGLSLQMGWFCKTWTRL